MIWATWYLFTLTVLSSISIKARFLFRANYHTSLSDENNPEEKTTILFGVLEEKGIPQ